MILSQPRPVSPTEAARNEIPPAPGGNLERPPVHLRHTPAYPRRPGAQAATCPAWGLSGSAATRALRGAPAGCESTRWRLAKGRDRCSRKVLAPYLASHRPCRRASEERDAQGRGKRRYRPADLLTPNEKLQCLPDAAAHAMSDGAAAGRGPRKAVRGDPPRAVGGRLNGPARPSDASVNWERVSTSRARLPTRRTDVGAHRAGGSDGVNPRLLCEPMRQRLGRLGVRPRPRSRSVASAKSILQPVRRVECIEH